MARMTKFFRNYLHYQQINTVSGGSNQVEVAVLFHLKNKIKLVLKHVQQDGDAYLNPT